MVCVCMAASILLLVLVSYSLEQVIVVLPVTYTSCNATEFLHHPDTEVMLSRTNFWVFSGTLLLKSGDAQS